MSELEQAYENAKNISSDINEHLPTLRRLAEKCDAVTEMGVRWACASYALFAAKPKKMRSYDLHAVAFFGGNQPLFDRCSEAVKDYAFIAGNTLLEEIDETDMLFIDTLHSYRQLSAELKLHSGKVKKWIVFHDTVSFAHHDEGDVRMDLLNESAKSVVESFSSEKKGLVPAVQDFVANSGGTWRVKETWENNNGLTVLERVSF